MGSDNTEALNAVYRERNLLVQLVADMALRLSRLGLRKAWDAWRGTDPDEPDWPVIYIRTPAGQISWHLPLDELVVDLPDMTGKDLYKWDKHTDEEKWERVRRLLRGDEDGR